MKAKLKAELGHLWNAIKSGSWAPLLITAVNAGVGFGWLDTAEASQLSTNIAAVSTGVNAVIAIVHIARGIKLSKVAAMQAHPAGGLSPDQLAGQIAHGKRWIGKHYRR